MYNVRPCSALSGELRRGLGCLADGIVGREVLRPHESLMLHQQFVGWHRDRLSLLSHGRSSSVMLEFRFMTLRNFSNLRLYSLSYFPAKIGYFSGLDIRFYGGPHTKMRVLDTAARFNSSCRCLDVNLVGHSGQNVRLSLAFSDDWILLSEVAFTSVVGHNRLNLESVSDRTKVSSSGPSRPVSRDITDFSVDNSGDTSKSESGGGLEAIYLLSILLCLLVGVVTAICSFWLVLVRRRSARRRISIKKRAIALAAHSHHHPPGANSYIIPYNQTNGHTLHHPQQQQQGLSSSTLPLPPPLPTYPTVDKRFYPSGSMRSMGVLVTSSNTLDPGKLLAKLSGGMDNSNVYTSILGSDNDSTLSPEYASTSMTAPVQGVSGGPDSVVYGPRLEGPFLPPPLEPLRPTGSSQLGLTLPASPSSSPSCSSPSSSSSAVPPAMSHPPSQIGPSFYPGSQPPLPPPYNLSFNDFTQPRRYHSPGYDQLRINSFI